MAMARFDLLTPRAEKA